MRSSGLTNDQVAWLFVFASSAACISGSCLICLDLVWNYLKWSLGSLSFSRIRLNSDNNDRQNEKLDFRTDSRFLISSLSLSSGVLIFTSLANLLPGSQTYLGLVIINPRLVKFLVIISYFSGVFFCAVFNYAIHALTSQSIVHCAHSHEPHGALNTNSEISNNEENYERYNTISNANHHHDTEVTPLIRKKLPKRNETLLDITNRALSGKKSIGKCMGYISLEACDVYGIAKERRSSSPALVVVDNVAVPFSQPALAKLLTNDTSEITDQCECCCLDDIDGNENISDLACFSRDSHKASNVDSHESQHAQPHHNLLHLHDTQYVNDQTTGTNRENTNTDHHHHNEQETCSSYSNADIHEPDHIHSHDHAHQDHIHAHYADGAQAEAHHSHYTDDHHHHILTKYSHLFSIGIQTTLAISLHKLPEGFLTFATSHADKTIGFNTFLALALHNLTEGFTIAFPLFLSLGSRSKAILIAALLGGCSQPAGALLAWLVFRNNIEDKTANMIFGVIFGLTSGFLSFIGFQMYGTAIGFGGSQNTTLFFLFLGILVVGLSSCLTL